jgi:hypothetical protein
VVTLAERVEKGDAAAGTKIKELMRSVITVVFGDPEALLKLENLGLEGYRIAFIPTEKVVPISTN